jgi:hypothetical protein
MAVPLFAHIEAVVVADHLRKGGVGQMDDRDGRIKVGDLGRADGEQQVVLAQIMLAKIATHGRGEAQGAIRSNRPPSKLADHLVISVDRLGVQPSGVDPFHLVVPRQSLED